ncbi:MAG: carboxypeptidase regulatory-like domain-containing protein [Myxococcota bacterium]
MILGLALAGCPAADTGPAPLLAVAPRAGSVAGTVVDADGAPVPGATLVTTPRGYEAVADDGGAFRIERLPPGAYALTAAAPGFEAAGAGPADVVAGEEAELTVTLTRSDAPALPVRVTVRGPDDAPLEGALVSAGGDLQTTDAGGLAVLSLAQPQGLDLQVTSFGMWPRTVRGLVLADRGGLSVDVGLSGRPPDGAVAVGSDLCARCHEEQGAGHAASRHGRAAALDADEPAVAFDDGWTVDLGDGAAAWLGPDRDVTLLDGVGNARTLTVAGWIGDPARASVPWAEVDGEAVPLPFAWVADDPARSALPEAQARVVPFEVARWLDGGVLRDPTPAEGAAARCLPCHVTGAAPTLRGDGGVTLTATWPFAADPRFVEAGVGCEACHGPGSGHLAASLDDKAATITRPDRIEAGAEVCASCHAAHTGPEGLPGAVGYAPGDALDVTSTAAHWPSGAAAAPGEQADELGLSPHGAGSAWPLGCPDCHDPHTADGLRREAVDNTLCLGCHPDAAHSGHTLPDPGSATGAGRCIGCHMPRTASRTDFGAQTGAGRLSSHLFVATPPADAVAAFDAAGADRLAPGAFPADPCQDCHAVALAVGGPLDAGPSGDPAERSTHETLQAFFARMFP